MCAIQGSAENCPKFKLGKTTISHCGAVAATAMLSIMQNQGKTAVLPVLPGALVIKLNDPLKPFKHAQT